MQQSKGASGINFRVLTGTLSLSSGLHRDRNVPV
jgi:hypothetical protein